MYGSQWPWVELFQALHEYDGADAYDDVLAPWAARQGEERRWLAELAARTAGGRWDAAGDEDLCRLYAAFRVASVLLLRFQVGRADGTDWPGPAVTVEGFHLFFEEMEFRVVDDVGEFHPFFDEIVGVRQAADPAAPLAVVERVWPAVMLGEMMFCRAGCVVSGGAEHVVKDVAEGSKLYWTYRRKDRPYNDLSHGWGSNSQWRTRLRRDYQGPGVFYYNVDGEVSLNGLADDADVDGLGLGAMRELVRHRCMVRTRVDDGDLFPYRYSYVEAIQE
jgi:hypothetical protein